MAFFVYPSGSASHTRVFEARDSSVPNAPYIGDHSIEWRVGGTVVKQGDTSLESGRQINTGELGDYSLDAADAGLLLDFVIDGSDTATGTTLTNNLPTIDSAGFEHQAWNLMPRKDAVFSWEYVDQDGDPQYYFRLFVGSADGLADYYDTGIVYGNPGDANGDGIVDNNDLIYVRSLYGSEYGDDNYDINADFNRDGVIDEDDAAIVSLFLGTQYSSGTSKTYSFTLPEELPSVPLAFWSLRVSDGEKVNPASPDWPEPARQYVEAKGMNAVNSRPIISNVLVDGV